MDSPTDWTTTPIHEQINSVDKVSGRKKKFKKNGVFYFCPFLAKYNIMVVYLIEIGLNCTARPNTVWTLDINKNLSDKINWVELDAASKRIEYKF